MIYLTLDESPKSYPIEINGGVFTVTAPDERDEISLLEAMSKRSFIDVPPLIRRLIEGADRVVDKAGNPIPIEKLKEKGTLTGALLLGIATRLIELHFASKEAEAKN